MPGSMTCLIWLTLGTFAIGTEGFMIVGLLPTLARDLNADIPAAGHLVTAFSLAYAFGAPAMAVLTVGLERRRMLAFAMSSFALANLLAALALGYAGLIGALLLALSAGTFMPTASGYTATLGGPEWRRRALSMVNNGLTLAMIAGVPLGVLMGEGFGWRATFLDVAGLALLSLLGILVLGIYGTNCATMRAGSTGATQSLDHSGDGFDPAERFLDPLAEALPGQAGGGAARRWASGRRTISAPRPMPPGDRGRGRGVAWAGIVLLAAALAAEYTLWSQTTQAAVPMPPPRVTVAKPLQEPVASTTLLLGQFSAVDTVELRAQVGGILTQIGFRDGQIVHAGDLLFTIDPRPFQIKLEQAIAQLQTAEAKQSLADVELWRARQLKRSDFGSAEVVDQRAADQHDAQAAIATAKAAIKDAELDLEFSRVTAPVTGRIGAHLVSAGNLVSGSRGGAGPSTLLATVVSLDPIYIDFDMSESDYRAYQRAHGGTTPRDDVEISLGGDDRFDRHGTLDFIDNVVNRSSGTIHARATVPNPDLSITPGQFARLRVPLGRPAPALLLPDAAVVPDQANEVVMTVAADGTIVPKPVQTGGLYYGLRVIRSGLAATDTVVIDGLVRVRPGAKVTPAQGTIATASGNDPE